MSGGYTGVQAAVKFKKGIRPKHNVNANGILGELQQNSVLLRSGYYNLDVKNLNNNFLLPHPTQLKSKLGKPYFPKNPQNHTTNHKTIRHFFSAPTQPN